MTSENPYAGQGPVLLDIGDDIGALVVTMPAHLDGVEVEINRIAGDDHRQPTDHHVDHHHHGSDRDHGHDQVPHRPHVAVVARPVATGRIPSLVFPELTEGRYDLHRRPAGPVELTVTIHGGQVTEASWPQRC